MPLVKVGVPFDVWRSRLSSKTISRRSGDQDFFYISSRGPLRGLSCDQRQNCKFGFHLAVPMGKRSPGNKSSSTSTPHVIALVSICYFDKILVGIHINVRLLGWTSCPREDLHLQKAIKVSKLDWHKHEGKNNFNLFIVVKLLYPFHLII